MISFSLAGGYECFEETHAYLFSYQTTYHNPEDHNTKLVDPFCCKSAISIYLFPQNSIRRVKENEAIQLEEEIMSDDKV
jgi:hypothetical protein